MRQRLTSTAPPVNGGWRHVTRFALAASIAALSLAASASQARATITVGQLFTPTGSCGGPITYLVTGVASGTAYGVPSTGVITSWSFQDGATPVPGLKLKVGRLTGGSNYMITAEATAGSQMPNHVNTYPANIPVQAGDLVGLYQNGGDCTTPTANASDTAVYVVADQAVGPSVAFQSFGGFKFPVSAQVDPTNTFSLGTITRNKKKGTATLNLTLPNPGGLTASGSGVKASGRAVISKSVGAGPAQLLIKAKGKKKKTLNATGKVKLKVAVTYTPTGGDPSTQSVKVKLKEK